MMNEPVSTIMTRRLITLSPEDTLNTVREIFSSHRIHHLPVVAGDDELIGLITTYDLFKLGNANETDGNLPVTEVMTKKLATLEPTAKVGTACEVFLENLFHALPIVDNGKLVGIVTTFDVLKYTHLKEYKKKKI